MSPDNDTNEPLRLFPEEPDHPLPAEEPVHTPLDDDAVEVPDEADDDGSVEDIDAGEDMAEAEEGAPEADAEDAEDDAAENAEDDADADADADDTEAEHPDAVSDEVEADPFASSSFFSDDDSALSFADMETPEELLPHRTPDAGDAAGEPGGSDAPVGAFFSSALFPPDLDRERPERPPLVPKAVWIVLSVAAAIIAIVVIGVVTFGAMNRAEVPNVTGIDVAIAQTRLEQAGFEGAVIERRFGSAPKGEVLAQSPGKGAMLRKGSTIDLIISAGTEELTMPDVVGDGVELARGMLEGQGLAIILDPVESDQPSNTVLASIPAAGATVRSGDVVRLTVAAPRSQNATLQPFDLAGVSVIIDPSPVAKGTSDSPLEVARRLRALLEASGASVTMLRTGADTATTDAARADRARAASATVAIGLQVVPIGTAGRVVFVPTVQPDQLSPASSLGSSVASALAGSAPPSSLSSTSVDPVFGGLRMPWYRVRLGSLAAPRDKSAMTDPAWQDTIARTIYTSLGGLLGKENL